MSMMKKGFLYSVYVRFIFAGDKNAFLQKM